MTDLLPPPDENAARPRLCYECGAYFDSRENDACPKGDHVAYWQMIDEMVKETPVWERHRFLPPVREILNGSGARSFVARCRCGEEFVTGTTANYAAGTAKAHATRQNRGKENK